MNIFTALTLSSLCNGAVVNLEKNAVYELDVSNAKRYELHISNHDQPKDHPFAVPIVGVTNVVIKGNGAKLLLKGCQGALLLQDTKNVRIENLTIDFVDPTVSEAEITGFEDGKTLGKWVVKGCHGAAPIIMLWDAKTKSIVPRTGDGWLGGTQVRDDGTLVFNRDFSKWGEGGKIGDRISMRTGARPHPAVTLYRAVDTVFSNVTIRNSHGMAMLAQRSENITFKGGGVKPRKGSFCSAVADATHFSNCRGLIHFEGAKFRGMMDDAINVHSTCLRIEEIKNGKTLRCRYVHGQSVGFEVFLAGETLRFIKAKTLENGPEMKVVAARMTKVNEVELDLENAVPDGYGVGDAVENADWQPSVVFRKNWVGGNRARGTLFTTPKKVVVEDNVFDHVSGAAVLLAGDAAGWYESGACQDVTIKGNKFIACNTSHYEFCNGVISIFPSVKDLKNQKTPYHTNITFKDNEFIDCPKPILHKVSCGELKGDVP